MSSAICFNLDQSKLLSSGNGLNVIKTRVFTPLSTVFQSYHGDSSHDRVFLGFSPVPGWGSEWSCPRTNFCYDNIMFHSGSAEGKVWLRK